MENAERVLRDWRKKVAEPTIELRSAIGNAETMNDMAAMVGEARAKVFFDTFREQIETFIAHERALLNRRRSEFQTARSTVSENFGLIQDTTGWVDHTNEVLAAGSQLLASAVDMETGMRGYLLAGEDSFLEPYYAGKVVFLKGLRSLRRSVADNPAQIERLQEIGSIIGDWIEQVAEPAIALRRAVSAGERPLQEIQDLMLRKEGKRFFDAFRVQILDFSQVETDLMVERQEMAVDAAAKVAADLQTMSQDEAWVTHTYQVIETANAILEAAVDMETGMRGYLLAGEEKFLAPYTEGSRIFYGLVSGLRETVSDNPTQVQLLDQIEQTISEWQEVVTEYARRGGDELRAN